MKTRGQPAGEAQIFREATRRDTITKGTPATFYVSENANAQSKAPWYALDVVGRAAVAQNDEAIARVAKEKGIDPDLLRSIVYVENAQGYYGHLPELLNRADAIAPGFAGKVESAAKAYLPAALGTMVRRADTILPANINPTLWKNMGIDERSALDPQANIAAAGNLVGQIAERTGDLSVAKIATLYNSLGKDEVSNFGARVSAVHEQRPWTKSPPRNFGR